jgi:hypothetical protein
MMVKESFGKIGMRKYLSVWEEVSLMALEAGLGLVDGVLIVRLLGDCEREVNCVRSIVGRESYRTENA